MIANTSLFHSNLDKTNNIQDHQHSLSSIYATENDHPINFYLEDTGLAVFPVFLDIGIWYNLLLIHCIPEMFKTWFIKFLVNNSPICSVVEILSNLIPHVTISSSESTPLYPMASICELENWWFHVKEKTLIWHGGQLSHGLCMNPWFPREECRNWWWQFYSKDNCKFRLPH